MIKKGVIIRHLPNCRPVAMDIIEADTNDYDNAEQYIEERAKDEIKYFKEKFVEFNSAEFYLDII